MSAARRTRKTAAPSPLTPSQQHAAVRCAPLVKPVAAVVVPTYQARG